MREGGPRLRRRGAGGPPAKLPKSENQAKIPMFSIISHPATHLDAAPPPNARAARSPASAPLPEVRHLAAPWRVESGRMSHAKSAKAAKRAGGKSCGGTMTGGTDAPVRPRGGWRAKGLGDLQAKSDTGESCGGEVGFMGGAALEKATVDGVDGVFQLRDA